MQKVYALSAKGQRERSAGQPTLPAELRDLLRLVDGQRTVTDLLAAARGKSAVTAGGLRWLRASGYLTAIEAPAAPACAHGGVASERDAMPSMPSMSSMPSRPAMPPRPRSNEEVCRILSAFMVQSIRRRLGEGGYLYRRQIERATQVGDLLPHLNPLIDAITARAGADAGAEFADTAAFILNPHDRDATLG
ncbi:MAG: hypothetical protein QM772_10155 [Ottowia sp.]|uniref:hypothetical protein n=1 Tax=Ottowia sp. TaxID=1898956 RepID=UPI0039E2759B